MSQFVFNLLITYSIIIRCDVENIWGEWNLGITYELYAAKLKGHLILEKSNIAIKTKSGQICVTDRRKTILIHDKEFITSKKSSYTVTVIENLIFEK